MIRSESIECHIVTVMNFQRFPDSDTALKDLDDRKSEKPIMAAKLPDTVITGQWVCVENDEEQALYFGGADKWLKVTIEDD